MNNKSQSILHGQTGSALVIVLLVLMSLTAIGLMAMRSSSIDMDIAASNKCIKVTWWATDGGNQMTTELIERNIEDRGRGVWETGQYGATGQVAIFTPDFWKNEENATCENNVPSKTNRDIKTPSSNDPAFGSREYADTEVYIKVYGATGYSPGAALDQTSGYDGRAKSAAGGGAQIVYNIRGYGDGAGPCEARILQVWRHLI
jgi:hypothetical protein